MTKGFRDKDRGWLRIRKKLFGSKGPRLKVGIYGAAASESHGDDFTNVEVASIQEFGSLDGSIPSRSFMRSTFDENRVKYEGQLKRAIKREIDGATPLVLSMKRMGAGMVGDIQKKINSGIGPELKEATLKARRRAQIFSSKPLNATTQMKGSVASEVDHVR